MATSKTAIRDAEVLVQRTFRQQRLIPAFMEPRSVVVDPTGPQLTVWSATQIPHILRLMLAMTLEIPEHKVRVIAPDVGGGFGGKLQVTPEEVIALLVARRLGKPVKYTESRSESMLAAHHGRDQIQKLTLAARRDGTVTGLKVELLADMGAYLRLVTSGIPILGAFMFNGIYKFPSYHFTCTNVFTNKVPTDAYRGAGRPEATFAIERMMDELAAELSRDPLELRAQNWITHEEFPFDTVAGLTYDSGNYEAATAQARELFDYDGLRREQAERRERRDPVQLGIGISTFTEMCGLAPSRTLGALSYGGGRLGARGDPRCCPPARWRWSPARRRTVRATRRRGARSSPTNSASRSRTSRSCTATPNPRHAVWTPTGPDHWRSARSRWSRPRRR